MRDKQPKERQMRKQQRMLARREASLEGLPAVLIVCEGRETEPNYIEGLCAAYNVNLAAIDIRRGRTGTDTMSLVRTAQSAFEGDRDFDRIFVVCDSEGPVLSAARDLAAKRLRKRDGTKLAIELIVSQPSFEYWLLAHFEHTDRAYRSADEAVSDLRRHLPDYDKADREIFAKVAAGLDQALQRIARIKADHLRTGVSSPDTDMPLVVEQLLSMRRMR